MSSRNDPRRQPQRNPLDGLGAAALGGKVINVNENPGPRKEEFLGGIEGELGWTPLGQMLAVRLVQSADGTTKVGKIVLPEGVDWLTSVYEVMRVGPDVKYVREGDHVLVSPQVTPSVIRYAGKSSLYVAEQQCFGYVDEVRARNEAAAKAEPCPTCGEEGCELRGDAETGEPVG